MDGFEDCFMGVSYPRYTRKVRGERAWIKKAQEKFRDVWRIEFDDHSLARVSDLSTAPRKWREYLRLI